MYERLQTACVSSCERCKHKCQGYIEEIDEEFERFKDMMENNKDVDIKGK